MANNSGRGISLGLVVICLIGLGGILYYFIAQLSQDIPESQASAASAVVRPVSGLSLHEAAEKGDTAAILAAIKPAGSVDAVAEGSGKSEGLTALQCAALAGKPEAVQTLLKAGAKVSARAKGGKTALIFAAGWGNAATVQAVLDGKPNVNERTDDRWTALMMAASRGDSGSIKVLIDAGADINDKNKWGQTALMAAARVGDFEKVAMLLQAGANVNEQDADGLTALAFACTADGALPSVQSLLAAKADPDLPDSEGVTPLMRAADMAAADKIAALLAAGVKKDVRDRDGRQAIDWARQRDDDAGKAAAKLLE